MLNFIILFIKQELKFINKLKFTGLIYLIFYLLLLSIFPLSLGYNSQIIEIIGLSLIFILFTFTSILVITQLFKLEYETGLLTFLVLTPIPFETIIFFNIIKYWIINFVPLLILSPLTLILLNINTIPIVSLLLILIISSLILIFWDL